MRRRAHRSAPVMGWAADMADIRIARPFRQADAYVPNSSARTRPVVAALDRLADTAAGVVRQGRADDEADRQAAHQVEMQRLERERAATIADGAGRFAEFRAGLDQYANETRVAPDAKPGAAGHGDKVAAEVERRAAEFRATLGNDPDVIARFEPLLQGEVASTIGRERAWELGQFGQYQSKNYSKYRDSNGIELQKAPTAENFKVAMAQTQLLVDGMKVSGNVRDTLMDDAGTYYARTVLDAQLAGGNSSGVRAIVKEGLFDTYLDPKLRDAYLQGADLVDQRAAAEAEQAQREQVKAAREAVATVKELIAQGAQPTPEQMKAAEAAGSVLPPSEKVELAGLAIGVDVAKRTRGWSAAQLHSWSAALQAKADAGAASQWEQMALQHVRARYDHAADAEATENKQLVANPEGRIAFAAQLARSPDRAAAYDSGERAHPGLGYVATVVRAPEGRRRAIEGETIRAAQPDLVPNDKANMQFRATLGRVVAGLGDRYDDVFKVANNIYASLAAEYGVTKDHFNAVAYERAVQMALGAEKRDGVQYGGVARSPTTGSAVLLPDNHSASSFARLIARFDFADARDGQNRPIAKSFIVGQMTPVFQYDNDDGRPVYKFIDGNGRALQHKGGGDFLFTVR